MKTDSLPDLFDWIMPKQTTCLIFFGIVICAFLIAIGIMGIVALVEYVYANYPKN